MKNYRQSMHLPVGNLGGETLLVHDVDNDGEKELLFRQSPGIFDSPYYPRHSGFDITPENIDLFRIVCMKQDGTPVWSVGEPWRHTFPYASHAAVSRWTALDIDGDGRTELVCIRRFELMVLCARTGELLRSTLLPESVYNIIHPQYVGGGKYNLIVKCGNKSMHGYGKPIRVYDCDLNFLWAHNDLAGGGHDIVTMDIDGDGREEIFEGYNLIDDDGTLLWSLDLPSHSDQTTVCDINGDGVDEVIYCTDNEDLVVANIRGEHLYTNNEFPHPQMVAVGNFIAGMPGKQMFMSNRATHGGGAMLDGSGRTLWEFPCNGYPLTLPSEGENGLDLVVFRPMPGRCPPDLQRKLREREKTLGYENLPISTDSGGFEPMILDGEGKILFRFGHVCDTLDVRRFGIPEGEKPDYGAGFTVQMRDIDGDGKTEFLFHTRTDLYVYHEVE